MRRGPRKPRTRRGRTGIGGALSAGVLLALGLTARSAGSLQPLRVRFEATGTEGAAHEVRQLELVRRLPLGGVGAAGSFSVFVEGLSGFLPTSIGLWTADAGGEPLDQLGPVPLAAAACPAEAAAGTACARAGPVWLVPSSAERGLPALRDVTLQGRVGGQVVVETGGHAQSLPVSGPRELAGRVHRLELVAHVLRTFKGGPSALDPDERRGAALATTALEDAAALWGQCGFALGSLGREDVRVVDAPRAELLEIGCEGGLPASGGRLQLETRVGPVRLVTRPGESAGSVAARLGLELERRGFVVRVAENPPVESSAGPSFDVLVQAPKASPDLRAPPGGGFSTDPTLGVCLGQVDLSDGLQHFEDESARAGTLEERTLLRGLADADPRTVDVVIVPYFAGRGRIGESFIGGVGTSLENLIVLDRAGIRATARSSTLAHELGHVLLSQPGHPDDFGLDDPSRLMDADASDATAFGPRRLSLEECLRALSEHGPGAAVPLLMLVPPATPPGAASSGAASSGGASQGPE